MNSDYKAGFEAGIRAAVEECHRRASTYAEAAEVFRDARNYNAADKADGNIIALRFTANQIAALTPEETDNG